MTYFLFFRNIDVESTPMVCVDAIRVSHLCFLEGLPWICLFPLMSGSYPLSFVILLGNTCLFG